MEILRVLITWAIVKAVTALGFGVITYGAVTWAINRAISEIRANYNSLPVEILQFLAIAGVPDYFGIVLGAITFVVAIKAMRSIALLPI